MSILHSARGIVAIATVVILAACAGGSPSYQPAGSMQSASRHRLGHSWVSPEAKSRNLMYISDLDDQVVGIFSWPGGSLLGQITGFFNPEGLCVDKAGNVWVTNDTGSGVHQITEYAHGGTTPIANLLDNDGRTNGCSINPVNGDLAVTNFFGATGQGSVSIYKNAQGTPLKYVSNDIYYYYYCGYDNNGNLFVDGWSAGSSFAFAELPKGGRKLKTIVLDHAITYPGGVQWDGRHMAVGDQYGPIYQFDISGTQGTEVGSTPLDQSTQIVQFWIQGGRVIGPNEHSANAMVWKYPVGGSPTKTLSLPGEGATVSLAK